MPLKNNEGRKLVQEGCVWFLKVNLLSKKYILNITTGVFNYATSTEFKTLKNTKRSNFAISRLKKLYLGNQASLHSSNVDMYLLPPRFKQYQTAKSTEMYYLIDLPGLDMSY